MINITDEARCCGCGSCVNACPTDCIKLVENIEGFSYPSIDTEKCVDCGLCEKACPYVNPFVKGDILNTPKAYYTRSKNDEILENSMSGGIFAELAYKYIENGGIVYGAVWGGVDSVYHKRADNREDLAEMFGSKYLQSDTKNCFKEVLDDLKSEKEVLFSGTPCQVAGLYSFLKQDFEKLLTCDLICHGVPTPIALRKYLSEMENKHGKKPVRYFRNKKFGWKPSCFTMIFEDGSDITIEPEKNLMNRMFAEHNTFHRKTCYACKFARMPRYGDITLGDYFVNAWAIEKGTGETVKPFDNKGTSLITVNTHAGLKEFSEINNKLECVELELSSVKSDFLFKGPEDTVNPQRRVMFFKLAERHDTESIYKILFKSKLRLIMFRLFTSIKLRIFRKVR